MKSNLNVQPTQTSAEPPSPTLSTTSLISSVSWMAEKTSNELIPMLKNAYSALKDKEKDLLLAAEIGKSLLEHNMHLKTSYDSLLHSTTPPITPSSSTSHRCIEESLEVEPGEEEAMMRIIPSRITRETMIEVLNKKNTEISQRLELALLEQDKLIKNNSKSTRKLEKEISSLKSNLEVATAKMEELENINRRQKKQEEDMASQRKKLQIDQELMEELYDEMIQMEQEKQTMAQSKTKVEQKLTATLKDLGELKAKFERFRCTEKDFQDLKEAYQRQFAHIEELKTSLEEHRNTIQFLKERQSDPDTLSQETSMKHTVFGSGDMAISFFGFESLLSKATGMSPQAVMEAIRLVQKIETESFGEDVSTLYSLAEIEEVDYPVCGLYPALIPPEQLQCYGEEPNTLSEKFQSSCQKLFTQVWKWCRFSVILTAAFIINAWHGPDSLLITC